MQRLLLLLSLTSVVSESDKCSHLQGYLHTICNRHCDAVDSYVALFLCEIANRTSTHGRMSATLFCLPGAGQGVSGFFGPECLEYVIQPFMTELSAGAVTQQEYNAALQAKANAEATALQAQADLDAAQTDAALSNFDCTALKNEYNARSLPCCSS